MQAFLECMLCSRTNSEQIAGGFVDPQPVDPWRMVDILTVGHDQQCQVRWIDHGFLLDAGMMNRDWQRGPPFPEGRFDCIFGAWVIRSTNQGQIDALRFANRFSGQNDRLEGLIDPLSALTRPDAKVSLLNFVQHNAPWFPARAFSGSEPGGGGVDVGREWNVADFADPLCGGRETLMDFGWRNSHGGAALLIGVQSETVSTADFDAW
ncbi:MAG: hypothetical protein U5L08_07780 [Xanthomonadales bacterium]|nr:hypothetical protein [Xanthomonadales bacterium]